MLHVEFLLVDDLAHACLFLMREYSSEQPVNIDWGEDVSILERARLVQATVGFSGQLCFDTGKPEGMPASCSILPVASLFGWLPKTRWREGVGATCRRFQEHQLADALHRK